MRGASAGQGCSASITPAQAVSVSVDSALKVSTVFACLRVLADGVAQVPLKVYRGGGGGGGEKADGSKELAKDHPAYWAAITPAERVDDLLRVPAGRDVSCSTAGERLRLYRPDPGVPRELIPLVPGSFTIEQARDYTLIYRLTGLNGQDVGPAARGRVPSAGAELDKRGRPRCPAGRARGGGPRHRD